MVEIRKYYTGIGAIDTPTDVLNLMVSIGKYFANKNYTLRSGGARGADQAFERGCGNGPKEIYLPFPNYEGNDSSLFMTYDIFRKIAALKVWSKLKASLNEENPRINLDSLPKDTQYRYARDVQQILGADFHSPSEKVIYWVPKDAKEGTRITLFIAQHMGVPLENLADTKTYFYWKDIIEKNI